MRINVMSVMVDDQTRALHFYTDVLGFVKKEEVPLGEHSWLTVVSPDDPDGTQVSLEPDEHPAARPFKRALVEDGIPFASFAVDDVVAEHERLVTLGVQFTQPPIDMGPVTTAVFDDTCGNLIQITTDNRSTAGATEEPPAVAEPFVPSGFEPPLALEGEHFRLEPLGPQHNEADHAAWTSSIDHIRSTPGFTDGSWPPAEGMSLDENLDDLRRHAADLAARTGFTFSVVDAAGGDVIGCVYLYPSTSADSDVTARSWVRASHADLDVPLADAVAAWLATDWPWERVHRPGR